MVASEARLKNAAVPRSWAFCLRAMAVLIFLVALPLLIGGVYLIGLSGSPYYALAGLTLAVAAILLWRRDRRGAWLYGLFLTVTVFWALTESGFDLWPLVPRIAGPAMIGLLLLLPPVQRGFGRPSPRWTNWVVVAGAVLLLIVAGVTIVPRGGPTGALPKAMAGAGDPTAAEMAAEDWPIYGRSAGGTRFSPLDQIDSANVARLTRVWTFRTGQVSTTPIGILEATPIKIDDTLYLCNSENRLFAVDAETGVQRWSYDPKPDLRGLLATHCRGVAYHKDTAAAAGAACAARIVSATVDARLIAVDAATGRPCRDFGKRGSVDLTRGMGPFTKGYYDQSSAPTIAAGRIIVGGAVLDNQTVDEPSGVVRAYDVITGRLIWAWDLGRPGKTGEPGPGERFTPGTPNVWAPPSVDEALGLVFLPTGNATPDFWGGSRTPEMRRYASSVVALDLTSGAVRWSFQTTHGDVWDYDVSSQPTLVDLPIGGRIVPALVQPTKRGETFVLDRRNGQPLSPVVEHPAPPSQPGIERLSPTQPWPARVPSIAGPRLTEAAMWGLTPIDQLWCRIRFRQARYDGAFTAPGLTPYIQYPGFAGGSSWGSAAVDPERHVAVLNASRFAFYGRLLSRADADRAGLRPFHGGVSGKAGEVGITRPQEGLPFAIEIDPFLSPLGVPCQQPPFGTIAAVDLRTMKTLWERPLGTAADSGPNGVATHLPIPLGTPNQGGALITRSGLIFIGATQERAFRALDLASGRVLWHTRLRAGANATPMTYRSGRSGRQFVVVAAGGNVLLGGPSDDALIAYALPDAD